MKIVGSKAELSGPERRLFQCNAIMEIGDLACSAALERIAHREDALNAVVQADPYGHLNHGLSWLLLERDRNLVSDVAGKVMVYELEEEHGILHEPTPHPRGLE